MSVRVRFAPSPTGSLHMGGARTALFNWLFARHHGGRFLLRIEDTDRARSPEESVSGILEGLRWLGIASDEPPLFQSSRVAEHVALARRLEREGHAYRCYCNVETLDAMREEQRARGEKPRYDRRCLDRERAPDDLAYVLRFLTPREGVTVLDDLVKGEVTVEHDQLDDLIILRSDGTPTYNFVVVADDAHMQVTHVIRGDDHLNNTFRQLHIYRALGLEPPRFGHLPLIQGLSKRLGSASVQDYAARGFLCEAVVNYIARLGWSHGDDEIFTADELIAEFDLDGVAKSPARFDENKLAWLNEHYLKSLPEAEVAARLVPFLKEAGYTDLQRADDRARRLVTVLKARSKTLVDMAEAAEFAYRAPVEYDPGAVKKWIKPPALEVLSAIAAAVESDSEFTVESLEAVIRGEAEARGLGLGKVAQPIRVCLAGSAVSPPLFDTLVLVGRDESLRRLRAGIEALSRITAPAGES